MTQDEIAAIADCANCPFAKNEKPPHRPVLAAISPNPIAVLIGEGPGHSEVESGVPFTGQTGERLDSILAREGIPRSKLILINAMACLPPPGKSDSMLRAASKCCAPLFKKQFAPYAALPKLSMGKWATWAVLGKAIKTDPSRGFVREGNLITTWHPTYAFFRNPWVLGDFQVDIAQFKKLIEGKLLPAPTIRINPNSEDVQLLVESINSTTPRFVGVDIETAPEKGGDSSTGKDPTRARIKTIGLGTATFAIAFKWPTGPDVWDDVCTIFADPTIIKVLHNGIFFDLRILSRFGIQLTNTTDTREMRRALVATSGLSLRYLGQTYRGEIGDWKQAEKDDNK